MAGKEDVPPASASKKRSAFAIIGSPLQRHRRPLAKLPPGEYDPQLCVPRATNIHSYLWFRETVQMKNVSASMRETVQMKNVSASMRGIFVDWFVEVADGFCAFPVFSWL
ncbi:hypothetical protein KSP40_PGU011099 [Platanthera guangdongensis]|uniref:Uncharacterized protein n=1 Tax=Platanthera guangdongensis TaxID=2320717 RepID=A0ABR2M7G6_9ASPA